MILWIEIPQLCAEVQLPSMAVMLMRRNMLTKQICGD